MRNVAALDPSKGDEREEVEEGGCASSQRAAEMEAATKAAKSSNGEAYLSEAGVELLFSVLITTLYVIAIDEAFLGDAPRHGCFGPRRRARSRRRSELFAAH